jgi:hypothetical protein
MDAREVATVLLVGAVVVGVMLAVFRVRAVSVPEPPPNPHADSPAVSATMAALGPQLAPGGSAGWLVIALGSERAVAEAVVASLHPGLPEHGAFAVNRLVGNSPVRLTGEVDHGVALVRSVERLDQPDPA